jgi:hypothetical protein
VVAGRDNVGASTDGIVENLFRNAKTACGVLAVDDYEVQLQIGNQPRQFFIYCGAARPAHHITKKKQSHENAL